MKKRIDDVLTLNNIDFADEFSLKIFNSHMDSLKDRIKNKEVLESEESEYINIMDELSDKALRISEDLMNIVFEDQEQPQSKMELVLIATHIQNSINNRLEKEESQ